MPSIFLSSAAILPRADHPADSVYLRDMAVLGGLMFVIAAIACLGTVDWAGSFPRDASSLVLGRDFLNLWMMGRGAFDDDPARLYDLATYNSELGKLLGAGYPGQNLPNPPVAFLALAPFGLLAYFPALFAWTALSWIAFVSAARGEVDVRTLALVAISPAALLCMLSGQSSFLTAAALIAIFAMLDRKPVLAGILIGFLITKPQLGLLFPVALIASQRWRVLAAAVATTIAMLSLSVAIFGFDVWHAYIFKALPLQKTVLSDSDGIAAPFQTSIFMNTRGMFGQSIAETLQLLCAIGSMALVAWAFRKKDRADMPRLRALFLACTASASPYMGSYDMLPLTFAAIALLAGGALDQTGRKLAHLVFWTPALQLVFGMVQLPGPGFIAGTFAIYLASRMDRDATQSADATLRA